MPAGARESQEMVYVVEPVDDFIPNPLFAGQLDFPRISLLDELAELGAGVGRAQLCGVRDLLGQHRPPPGREAVKDPAPLNGQLLDPGLEVRRLLVNEALQILERGAERRLDQHSAGEYEEPGIASGQPAHRFQPATLPVQGFRKIRVAVPVPERREHPARVVLSKPLQNEQPEEFVEGLAVPAYRFEYGVGRPDEQNVRSLDEIRTQGVDFAFPPELPEKNVEVLDEQDQPLPVLLTEIP